MAVVVVVSCRFVSVSNGSFMAVRKIGDFSIDPRFSLEPSTTVFGSWKKLRENLQR
jgi:hypothetical protein